MAKRRGQPSAVKLATPPTAGPFRGAWTQNGHLLPKAKRLIYVLSGGLILASAVGISDELPALLRGTRAYADVISIREEGPDAYYAQLQIPGVGPATTVRLERYRRRRPLQVGQRVRVAYTGGSDASQPAQAVPLNSTARWPGSLFYSGLGAFMLWLSRRRT